MREPIETAELVAFTRVVEARSLTRAAAELGTPRATIGRRLAQLERRLGTRLLRRTTRSLALTDSGEIFYRHARIVLDAMAQAQASVRAEGDVIRGDLRVSVPTHVDPTFREMLAEFARRHREVRVQVDFTTRHVDLLRDGYDVALRASIQLQPGLVARVLSRHELIAVASPAYLAEHGAPRTVKDLKTHRCLTGFARGELPQTEWPAGRGVVHVVGAFSSNDLPLLLEGALRGLGIALMPRSLAAASLEAGALVQVLPAVLRAESTLAVVYPEREFLPAHVRAFVDALVAWASRVEPATGRIGPRRSSTRGPRRSRARGG